MKTSWVSEIAKDKWEPVFNGCSSLFQGLEREAVKCGLKKATIQTVSPTELDQFTYNWLKHDFMVLPIEKIQNNLRYQSGAEKLDITRPWNYKVLVGKFEDIRDIVYAYRAGDNTAIGRALGYPECCIKFFNQIWVDDKWLDTSVPMAGGIVRHDKWNPYCNILLRWAGLRLVSHLPCSFHCGPSSSIGETYKQLAYDLGYRTTVDALYDILSWPIEWTGLHGIGIVSTPVCRISFRTDMLREEKKIQLVSYNKPDEAARGLSFPYTAQRVVPIKQANANGFFTKEAETKAHNLILDLIRYQDVPPSSVIDLGCGNMELLRKIVRDFRSTVYGIDADAAKNPDVVSDIFHSDYFDRNFDLAIISKARISENLDGWLDLLKIIQQRCRKLIIYSYDNDESRVPVGTFALNYAVKSLPYLADLYELRHEAQTVGL